MLAQSRGSMPSMPITITFLPALRETREQPPSQYEVPATPAPTAARFRKRRRLIFPEDKSDIATSRSQPRQRGALHLMPALNHSRRQLPLQPHMVSRIKMKPLAIVSI